MKTDLGYLQPIACEKASIAIGKMLDAGIMFKVTSTLRDGAEQIALFAQGRKTLDEVNMLRKTAGMYLIQADENSYTVTNCDGKQFKSAHQTGLALDVVPADCAGRPMWPDVTDARWPQIAKFFIDEGFTCGSEWGDCPHYQLDI